MNELTAETIPDPTPLDTLEFDLGSLLGERKVFGLVAGRCSAAHAEHLKQLRDRKLFKGRCNSWEEFCPKYLRLSRGHANRIIQALEEFGPEYFQLAELTRITPEEFRAIAPEVKNQILHLETEAIAIRPENAARLMTAVAKLRSKVPTQDLARFERRCDRLVAEFRKLSSPQSPEVSQSLLASILDKTVTALQRVRLTLNL